ncbi:hypothetical protein OENI_20233 [Oenococcus oeni]|uniref:hypothetical protein n=1 Tax=Oenococcus oeni TaxID=1247 RepID=UPI0010B1C496|nr:hypothetical protein [Oenococcus oeni]SYW12260.1 hypothetical protein OENI_20233 [Oenococcus oeni]
MCILKRLLDYIRNSKAHGTNKKINLSDFHVAKTGRHVFRGEKRLFVIFIVAAICVAAISILSMFFAQSGPIITYKIPKNYFIPIIEISTRENSFGLSLLVTFLAFITSLALSYETNINNNFSNVVNSVDIWLKSDEQEAGIDLAKKYCKIFGKGTINVVLSNEFNLPIYDVFIILAEKEHLEIKEHTFPTDLANDKCKQVKIFPGSTTKSFIFKLNDCASVQKSYVPCVVFRDQNNHFWLKTTSIDKKAYLLAKKVSKLDKWKYGLLHWIMGFTTSFKLK